MKIKLLHPPISQIIIDPFNFQKVTIIKFSNITSELLSPVTLCARRRYQNLNLLTYTKLLLY